MKKTGLLLLCAAVTAMMIRCNSGGGGDNNTTTDAKPIATMPFPTVNIPGFSFPTDSNRINKWIDSNMADSIYLHGWGIWAGLTTKTGEKIGMEESYIYETWYSPKELKDSLKKENLTQTRKARTALHVPVQLEHAAHAEMKMRAAALNMMQKAAGDNSKKCNEPKYNTGVYKLIVTVAYNPQAAQHILSNKLYDSSVLAGFATKGNANIPEFPNNSIVIKPTYELIPKEAFASGFFPLRIWEGPDYCDSGFVDSQWKSVVYIDVNNKSQGDGSADNTNLNKRMPQNSYNLNSMIYYTVTGADTANIKGSRIGDIVVLVGMHVTTKEIKRWTWQTYWWSPETKKPPVPSSEAIASKRPSQITGAPAHYAMAIGYTFTMPNQPLTGGNKNGTPVIAFNPYLESGFGVNVFYEPGRVIEKGGKLILNRVGCQTGCMSCHALATFDKSQPVNPALQLQPSNYIPDTYIDMVTDSNFTNRLQLDFLWSIQSNLISK